LSKAREYDDEESTNESFGRVSVVVERQGSVTKIRVMRAVEFFCEAKNDEE